MADVNWKSIGGISIIGGLIGYVSAWNKERRYRNYLVNKFGVFDAESFSAEEDYCDDCGSTDNVCAVTDLCDDCMDSAGYDWDGRNRPNECPHCGEMDSMFIYEGRWECEECDKLAYDAESFSAEEKPNVHANNDGKPCNYLNGDLSWDISYWTPDGRGWLGDINKDPKRKNEGYKVWIKFNDAAGDRDSVRLPITPKLLDLTKFKTMPQVKKAFKKFVDDLLAGKMKCQEGGETLTWKTIESCSGCGAWDRHDIMRKGYICKNHNYTSDKLSPIIVFDDGRTLKRYSCKKHIKQEIWRKENPDGGIEYKKGGKTISDSDLIPKEKFVNPRERRIRQRFGLGAETFEAESKKTNEMDKFFEWILKENPTSRQTTKPYSRKVDYLAQRYSDEELKAGLVNAYNAGDIDNAKLFAAALGRQGFISKYQAERKVY